MAYAVVYLHGFASGPGSQKAVFFADFFRARGITFVAPDLNLPAFASLTITRMIAAAEEAARPFEQVCVVGSSLGAYAAAHWATQRKVVAGMLIAPAFAAHQLWQARLPAAALQAWQQSGSLSLVDPQGRYLYGRDYPAIGYSLYADALEWDARPPWSDTPFLVFHGEADDTVPVARSREFAARAQVTLQTFPGAGHGLVEQAQEMAEKTLAFFNKAAYPQGG